jgi:hypothetical protein
MQADLDAYLITYNTKRSHQGRGMKGRTPLKAFTDGLPRKENAKINSTKKVAQPGPPGAATVRSLPYLYSQSARNVRPFQVLHRRPSIGLIIA